MPRKQSKPTDKWVARLQAEMLREDKPPENGLTLQEIRKLRKERGMTWGQNQAYRWVTDEIEAGRISRFEGYFKQSDGRTTRKVYYILK